MNCLQIFSKTGNYIDRILFFKTDLGICQVGFLMYFHFIKIM